MRRVLVVDDDKENIDLLTNYLSSESGQGNGGISIQTAQDGEGALHRIRAWKPHLVLLDINMPGASGLEIIPKIRNLSQEEYTAVVLVSANMSVEEVTQGFEAGADDYLTKPFRAQELFSRVRTMLRFKELQDSLKRASYRIEELSSTDELTGLVNMRAAYRRGEEEIVRCKRFRKPVSALVVNLDQFSDVNQNVGFVAGSKVLQETALRIRQCVRSMDVVARVGADEFFVLLSETDLAAAEFVAERIRDAIQSNPFKTEKQSLKVTGCVGVASISAEQSDQRMAELFHNTSEALRSAKANGANRIEIYSFA